MTTPPPVPQQAPQKQAPAQEVPKKKNTVVIIVSVIAGVFFMGIVGVGILAAMILPALGKARAKARSVNCASNMKMIGVSMLMFSYDHEGRLPNDFKELVDTGYVDTDYPIFCPSAEYKSSANYAEFDYIHPDYEYLGGGLYDHNDKADITPIMIEKIACYKGKYQVLFLDGHVESIEGSTKEEVLEDLELRR